jgi:hypothetical protein
MTRTVPSPVAGRRLEIFAAARADPAGFLRLDPSRVRFSLGTSAADFSIPIEVGPQARAIVRGAAAEVALLLSIQHRAFVPADDLDRLILREEYASLPQVAPVLGSAGSGGPDLRAAAQLAPALHPALTGGIVGAWMGRGGKGRSLVALWIELFRTAFEEMAASKGREETPLLVALALSAETAAAESALRECLPAPPLDRYVRTAALCALWAGARTGLARAWRDSGRRVGDPLLARIEAALNPSPVLGGRAGILGGGATLYGCELSAGIPRADEGVARLGGGADPEAVAGDLSATLARDEELARRAEQAVAVARLREILAAAASAAEEAGQGAHVAPLRDLYVAPGALAAAIAEDASRRVLLATLSAADPGGEAGGLLGDLSRALKAWRQKEPAAALGFDRPGARAEYASAATALLCDVALERLTAPVRRALNFRTGREAEGGTDAEWEAGRLYRLRARGGPILKSSVEAPVGHLFADVKDFTRRTAVLGQAAMAEFLRREFYLPVVVAAKEHVGGMRHLADRGGVQLNNLLGDAITFSGGIVALVGLARDIRRNLADYGNRLAREASSDAVSRQVAEVESAHAPRIAAAARARAEAEEAAGREPADSPGRPLLAARALRLAAEETRLAEERERAVARVRGEGLEAGVFISHGAAPLVITIDDEVFGRSRVAIADKINESARGTARAASARMPADAALARERAVRGNPALVHAWSVFIGQPLQVAVPFEAEEAALRAARAGDLQGAMRVLGGPVREALESAAREQGARPGDIYNSGAALSEDALMAFLSEVEGTRVVRRVEVTPEEIPDRLRARWFFGAEPQSLVVCLGADGRVHEMFRRVGTAAFKGLGSVVVWELCADGGAAGALAAALGSAWARGAQ